MVMPCSKFCSAACGWDVWQIDVAHLDVQTLENPLDMLRACDLGALVSPSIYGHYDHASTASWFCRCTA